MVHGVAVYELQAACGSLVTIPPRTTHSRSTRCCNLSACAPHGCTPAGTTLQQQPRRHSSSSSGGSSGLRRHVAELEAKVQQFVCLLRGHPMLLHRSSLCRQHYLAPCVTSRCIAPALHCCDSRCWQQQSMQQHSSCHLRQWSAAGPGAAVGPQGSRCAARPGGGSAGC